MNYVEPIRNRKKIAQIINLLRGQRRYRDLLLFVVGINSALRISDLLRLKIGQLLDDKGESKSRIWIKEHKRGKRHEVAINHSIQDALAEYLKEYPHVSNNGENYLFFNPTTHQPIKRGQGWKFITKICAGVVYLRELLVDEPPPHFPISMPATRYATRINAVDSIINSTRYRKLFDGACYCQPQLQ